MKGAASSLLRRLRERKMVQWSVAYLAGAWLLLQVLDLLAQPFAWPSLVLRAATVLLGVGFFAALVVAWYHGERGEQRATRMELLMLAGILIVAGAGVRLVAEDGRGERDVADFECDGMPSLLQPENSVAVLPFENMSADPEQEYFSIGITEEILNALARIPTLRVPARTSSFQFRGERIDAREVGRRLGVAHVLEGSVRKGGDRVRITVQLISAADGYHMWSQTYDREMKDVLAVQDEIARSVAAALSVRIGANASLVRSSTASTAAYELYLRGRFLWGRPTPQNYERAMELYEEAIRLDPGYAMAYAGLADAYIDMSSFSDRSGNMERGLAALRKALELDPENGQAHDTQGYVLHTFTRDYAAAEQSYRRSLQLDAQNAAANTDYGRLLSHMGRSEEALRYVQRGVELDPLSAWITRNLAHVYHRMGRLDDAMRTYAAAVEIDPAFSSGHFSLGDILLVSGRTAEAKHHFEVAAVAQPHRAIVGLARVEARLGRTADARRMLQSLHGQPDPGLLGLELAEAYAEMGDFDEAFRWIDAAFESNHLDLPALAVNPRMKPLHGDPRFAQVLRRAGLEDVARR
jgi:TolB-like protein/Flp pilus assembly protein TadD